MFVLISHTIGLRYSVLVLASWWYPAVRLRHSSFHCSAYV